MPGDLNVMPGRVGRGLATRRMHSLRLAGQPTARAEDVVRWLGAVQSQDYGPAKWSVGQRTSGLTGTDVERAVAAGTILRTHVLRPTWHFVVPADIELDHEMVNGVTYWSVPAAAAPEPATPTVHLLQAYDEYVVGYSESRHLLDRSGAARMGSAELAIEVALLTALNRAQRQALDAEAERHAAFLGLPLGELATRRY